MQGEKKINEDRSTEIVGLSEDGAKEMEKISDLICSGANSFLFTEYLYLTLFIILFGTLIYFVAEHKPGQFYTTIAFVTGAYTSIICGYIGMVIATRANYRTAYKAQ
jgi:Na+/H+-translocating membrane pyrophosphatase